METTKPKAGDCPIAGSQELICYACKKKLVLTLRSVDPYYTGRDYSVLTSECVGWFVRINDGDDDDGRAAFCSFECASRFERTCSIRYAWREWERRWKGDPNTPWGLGTGTTRPSPDYEPTAAVAGMDPAKVTVAQYEKLKNDAFLKFHRRRSDEGKAEDGRGVRRRLGDIPMTAIKMWIACVWFVLVGCVAALAAGCADATFEVAEPLKIADGDGADADVANAETEARDALDAHETSSETSDSHVDDTGMHADASDAGDTAVVDSGIDDSASAVDTDVDSGIDSSPPDTGTVTEDTSPTCARYCFGGGTAPLGAPCKDSGDCCSAYCWISAGDPQICVGPDGTLDAGSWDSCASCAPGVWCGGTEEVCPTYPGAKCVH